MLRIYLFIILAVIGALYLLSRTSLKRFAILMGLSVTSAVAVMIASSFLFATIMEKELAFGLGMLNVPITIVVSYIIMTRMGVGIGKDGKDMLRQVKNLDALPKGSVTDERGENAETIEPEEYAALNESWPIVFSLLPQDHAKMQQIRHYCALFLQRKATLQQENMMAVDDLTRFLSSDLPVIINETQSVCALADAPEKEKWLAKLRETLLETGERARILLMTPGQMKLQIMHRKYQSQWHKSEMFQTDKDV